MTNEWQAVVFAADLPDCDGCDDKWCWRHEAHYADCPCIGPTQEGYMYKEIDGKLMARPMTAKERKRYEVPGTV